MDLCRAGSAALVLLALLVCVPQAHGAKGGVGGGKGGGGGTSSSTGWFDDFDRSSLTSGRKGKADQEPVWVVSDRQAPGYRPSEHLGRFDPAHVTLQGGYLALKLVQAVGAVDTNPDAVLSVGGQVHTQASYGYGTYEWRARMASTAPEPTAVGEPRSGGVSALFNYADNSRTEIDFEFSGHVLEGDPLLNDESLPDDSLFMVNWLNVDPEDGPWGSEHTESSSSIAGINDGFHVFRFVWLPDRIEFYVDDQWQVTHTSNVPALAAPVFINHWGTHGYWGGAATLDGQARYLYVDWVRFTPRQP